MMTDRDLHRFMRNVDITETCWLWTAKANQKGYGVMSVDSMVDRVHRIAYRTFVGPIPNGLSVLHHCDVKRCVRPGHLYLGDNADNMRDAKERGLINRGAQVNTSRLTDDQVRRIYADPRRQVDIATDYGVTQPTVSAIKRGVTWRHVTSSNV